MRSFIIVAQISGLILWPLSLYLANTKDNFLIHAVPTLILLTCFFLYTKKTSFFYLPIIPIPFIEQKLTPFIIIFLFLLLFSRSITNKKFLLLALIITIALSYLKRDMIIGQTITSRDYEKQQEILREINLYPNVFTARLFQNKLRIVFDKFSSNVFALTDPGNYFFSFHPREDVLINQNLVKFPFLALIPLFIGFLYLKKNKNYLFVTFYLIAAVCGLSVLTIFDRHDFILWLPFVLIFLHGMQLIEKHITFWKYPFYGLLTINFLIEFLRILNIY